MVGYNINRFVDLSTIESLVEYLKCSICLNIFDTAVDTKCRHTFCYNCINEWIQNNDRKECPECRQSMVTRKRTRSAANDDNDVIVIGSDVLLVKNRRLNAIISKLKTKCDNEWNGCPEVMPLELIDTHLKTCQYKMCRTCGHSFAGNTREGHNCVEVLVKDRQGLKTRVKELEGKCAETDNTCQEIDDKYNDKKYNELNEKFKESQEICQTKSDEVKELRIKLIASEDMCHDLFEYKQKALDFETKCQKLTDQLKAAEQRQQNKTPIKVTQRLTECQPSRTSTPIITMIDANSRRKTVNKVSPQTPHGFQVVDIDCPDAAITLTTDFIMFGTYKTDGESVVITEDGIKLTNVASNKTQDIIKYNIRIPFIKMQRLLVCTDSSLPVLAIKPTDESSDKIQQCLNLGRNSPTGLEFDINSINSKHKNIVIVLKDAISDTFGHQLFDKCKRMTNDCDCQSVNRTVCSHLLYITPAMRSSHDQQLPDSTVDRYTGRSRRSLFEN